MPFKFRTIILPIAATLCLTAAASAGTITQSFDVDFATDSNASQTFAFELFTGPDVLTDVTLDFDVTQSADASVSLCQFFLDCETGTLGLAVSIGETGVAQAVLSTGFSNETDDDQFASLLTTLQGSFEFASFDPFIAGTSEITVSTIFTDFFNINGGHTSGNVTLTYTTEPVAAVPLPASSLLL